VRLRQGRGERSLYTLFPDRDNVTDRESVAFSFAPRFAPRVRVRRSDYLSHTNSGCDAMMLDARGFAREKNQSEKQE
jgi:hypothetical protein